MKIFIKIILTFLCFYCIDTAAATVTIKQDRYARFVTINKKNGLVDNHILDITQDSTGFIWIATQKGLSRYDGYHFINFTHSADDSLSISDNYVQSLAIDKEGVLWIGTKKGLNKYDSHTGTFCTWSGLNKGKSIPSNPNIRKILPDSDDVLWVETVDGVLNKIDTKTGNILYYPHQAVTQEYYSYHCLFKDSDGDIWVGNRGKGPYIFKPNSGSIRFIKHDPARKDKKRDQEVAYVLEDSNHRFWVGSIDGFWRFYKDTETFERIIPMSSFHCIEDREGTLWLSGGKGIYRYDANTDSAVLYSNSESDQHSLISNSVNAIFEDRDGNIWIGTDEGISVFSKPDNNIRYIRRLFDSQNSLTSDNITSVLEDKDGNIWFGTQKKGLSKWNPKTDTFTNFKYEKGKKNTLAANNVSSLYQDNNNNIWIGLWRGIGFNRYDVKTNKFKKFSCDPNSLKKDWYSTFLEDSQGKFMAGLWGGNGIHIFNREKEKFLPYNFSEYTTPMDFPLTSLTIDNSTIWTAYNNIVFSYKTDTKSFTAYRSENIISNEKVQSGAFKHFYYSEKVDDHIYWATSNGILVLDSTRNKFQHLLPNTEITTLTKNNYNGILWLGTNNGLGVLTKDNEFKLIESNDNSEGLLWRKEIISLKEIRGKLYVSTNRGLLIFDPQNNSFIKWNNETEILLSNSKVNALIPRNSDILIGTDNNLIKIDFPNETARIDTLLQGLLINGILPQTKKNKIILATNKGILVYNNDRYQTIENTAEFNIFSLKEDSDGQIWAGSNKGLLSVSPNFKQITLHNQPGRYCLTSHLISFLANDSLENIWAGTTNKGLNRINSKTLEIDHFYPTLQDAGKYSETKASVFLQQKDGTIWVGGENLHRLNQQTDKFEIISDKSFTYKEIYSLQEDGENNLWIGTANGLVFYDTQNGVALIFNYLHGLPDFDFSGGSLRLSNGNLLFAGEKGAIIFNPESLSKHSDSRNIIITGIKIPGYQVLLNTNSDAPVELKYNQNFFTLEFSTMQFGGLKENYQYKLEGIDRDWVVSHNNRASYTNIQPGNYYFKVRSNNGAQDESTFQLIIQPPFWKTWWFILLTIAVLAGFISYWIRIITRKQRTEEQRIILEHKLLQLQMNPHFIFNVLIAIQSFIYRKDSYESGLYLSKFAKLMRIFLQNSRNEWITLSKEIKSLQYYLNLQQLRIENKFECAVGCKNIPDPDYIHIPPMIIQPFVENSVEHGIANLSYSGIIEISFEIKEKCLEAIIRDNGKGYYPKKEKAAQKDHKSMATEIIRKRIKIMNNSNCKTGLTIRNRNRNTEGTSGTEVIIKLPYKEEF